MERFNDKQDMGAFSTKSLNFYKISVFIFNIGIAVGFIYIYLYEKEQHANFENIMIFLLDKMQTIKIDYFELLKLVCYKRMIQFFSIMLVFCSKYNRGILSLVTLYIGISIGIVFSICISIFDIKGVLLWIGYIMPHGLFYLLSYLGITNLDQVINKKNFHKEIKIMKMIVFFVLGILTETFVMPIIMKKLSLLF